ncbi:MAG TPA: GNAT family N-acetyltransferase [bacterium]|nr:GNAT family N-acetyltransferase [bacterium]
MITLTKASPEDVLAIQTVLYKTWLATYPSEEYGITVEDIEARFKERFTTSFLEKRRQALACQNDNELFLVAKDQQEIVGICSATRSGDRNELMAIYVLPSYQGRGIGQIFWQEINKFFDSKLDIFVCLAVYNLAAMKFYQKLGFVDNGRRFTQEKLKMPISGNYIPEMEMVIKHN